MFALMLNYMEQTTNRQLDQFQSAGRRLDAPLRRVGRQGAASNSTAYNTRQHLHLPVGLVTLQHWRTWDAGLLAARLTPVRAGNTDIWHWWYGCPATPTPRSRCDGMFEA